MQGAGNGDTEPALPLSPRSPHNRRMSKHETPPGGSDLSRRQFMSRSLGAAGAAALLQGSAQAAPPPFSSPNDAVGVGFIGIGIRGEILMRATKAIAGTRIVEVCDAYDGHFDRARELMGSSLRTGRDYRRVLDNPDVQAVVIATPDHWHRQMALDAIAAGKDVYLEKPMTHRWQEGPEITTAARGAKRILQVGSQWASSPANVRATEIIKSGKLGKVTLVHGAINRNTATGAWYYPVAPDASPETIDWDRFLGPAPKVPFDARRFFQWRLFWDYSGGLPTDLFVHMITATHTIMGVKMASRVMALGGIYHWHERREVPDQMTAVAEYPEGFALTMTATANNGHDLPFLTVMGTEGTLEYHGSRLVYYAEPMLENYNYSTTAWPEPTRQKFAESNDLDPKTMRPLATAGKSRPEPEEIPTPGRDSTEAHLAAFFESVRTRTEPFEDGEMGSLCATVGHMVNLSYKARKEVSWDGSAVLT
jgi:predicted dehydrogenase